jgi:glycosyltransferase involved in cell wall biosynthesis
MSKAFPDAPIYTSLFDPKTTFPEFGRVDVRPLPINRIGVLRRHHRWALPVLAPCFSRLCVDADVALCSSSGWAHGAQVTGRKVVYCHSPAKWLYRAEEYTVRHCLARHAAGALRSSLERWDRRAAASAHRYLANSVAIRDQIASAYSIDADLLPAPHTIDSEGAAEPVAGIQPGFLLIVSRLLSYKNVDAVVAAFAEMPNEKLVVAGAGPEAARLEALAPSNVRFVGAVADTALRWLYANSSGLISAAYEDYGLTPLEAATFGKPAAVLRRGGFLDTVAPGRTGVFFDQPTPAAIQAATLELLRRTWDRSLILSHAETFSESLFIERLRSVVFEAGVGLGPVPRVDKSTRGRVRVLRDSQRVPQREPSARDRAPADRRSTPAPPAPASR